MAAQVVQTNGLEETVQIIASKSCDIDSGLFVADMIVSELLDTALLGEGCLPSHRDAVARGLIRHGEDMEDRIMPHSAEVFACLIHSDRVASMKSGKRATNILYS